MSEYANVKRRNICKLLNWLCKKDKFLTVGVGGKHTMVIKYNYWERPFPVPFKNSEVRRFYVKTLLKKLVDSEICTKEEFDKYIK